MALIHQLIVEHLPHKRKTSPRGWMMFNAPCCHHRGHKQDTRMRGNMLITEEGQVAYNCYNCGFKTVYDNLNIGKNFNNLLSWLNVPEDDVKLVKLELLHNKINGITVPITDTDAYIVTDFTEVKLPEHARPIQAVMEDDELDSNFVKCCNYIASRGSAVAGGWDYYWSSSSKWDLNHRLIVPFYHKNKIVVWTARYAGTPPDGTPRYYNSDLQTGYLFNCDAIIKHGRKYVVLVEGPFDAIAIDGVAALGSKLSKQQLAWLKGSDKEIVVLPDRQRKNQGLIDIALEHRWAVSFPDWDDDIKDAADASCRYGKLFTLQTILDSRTKNYLQINVKRRMFRS